MTLINFSIKRNTTHLKIWDLKRTPSNEKLLNFDLKVERTQQVNDIKQIEFVCN